MQASALFPQSIYGNHLNSYPTQETDKVVQHNLIVTPLEGRGFTITYKGKTYAAETLDSMVDMIKIALVNAKLDAAK